MGEEKASTSLEARIEDLAEERDVFFLNHPGASLKERNVAIQARVDALRAEIRAKASTKEDEAWLWPLLEGRLISLLPSSDDETEAEALQLLETAAKLAPNSWQAQVELGRCFQRRGEKEEGARRLRVGLERERNATTLSMVASLCRSEAGGKSGAEARDLVRQSLNLAKEAAAADPNSDEAQLCLGNAFLHYFFACDPGNGDHMSAAVAAYEKAAQGRQRNSPDLRYNLAQALVYEQNYAQALKQLRFAARLDPSFHVAKSLYGDLRSYLEAFATGVRSKGKLRGKRLERMKSAPIQLGPYASGAYANVSLRRVALAELTEGANHNRVVAGRVAAVIHNALGIPYSFVLLDSGGDAVGVAVYNFTPAFGVSVSSAVAIPEPFLLACSDGTTDEEGGSGGSFPCIRIPSPQVLVLNGRKLGKDSEALTEVNFAT